MSTKPLYSGVPSVALRPSGLCEAVAGDLAKSLFVVVFTRMRPSLVDQPVKVLVFDSQHRAMTSLVLIDLSDDSEPADVDVFLDRIATVTHPLGRDSSRQQRCHANPARFPYRSAGPPSRKCQARRPGPTGFDREGADATCSLRDGERPAAVPDLEVQRRPLPLA